MNDLKELSSLRGMKRLMDLRDLKRMMDLRDLRRLRRLKDLRGLEDLRKLRELSGKRELRGIANIQKIDKYEIFTLFEAMTAAIPMGKKQMQASQDSPELFFGRIIGT